ncbi:MAG: MmgE/PrpD family protein [Azonexus sp.]|jgi:2-methylcitrate dehydratase PrpD|nr:MmgE/PrpD family protein [Azonexus sp.]
MTHVSSDEPRRIESRIPGLTLHIPVFDGEEPLLTLARFTVETRFEDIQPEVIEFAKRLVIDVLGVTIGGSAQETIPELVDYVRECGGKEESLLPFYGGKYPAASVALALAPMSRALDMGDVHMGWPEQGFSVIGHTAEYTLPTLLAASGLKSCVTGKEFLTAFAIGTEVLVRIGAAANNTQSGAFMGLPGNFDHGGWFIFGAVAAVASLLGLSVEQTLNALGMARCMTQTHDMKSMSPASHMVRVHHGFVAKNAIDVCRLAMRGINGPHDVMLGYRGFLFAITRGLWPAKPELLTRDLGKVWFFTHTCIKPFSACKATHNAATAVLMLEDEHGFTGPEIASIHVGVSPNTLELCCRPVEAKWHPQSDQNAQFSLPYVISVVAFERRFMIDGFKAPMRAREDIRQLVANVTADVEPGVGVLDAHVTVRLRDGQQFSIYCDDCKGTPTMPLSDTEWRERLLALCQYAACPIDALTANRLLDTLFALEGCENIVCDIIAPLTP